MFQQVQRPASAPQVNLCLDAGYISPDTEGILENLQMIAYIRLTGEEKQR
jgi:hypothetical protein